MKQILQYAVVLLFAQTAAAQWTRVDSVPPGESYGALSFGDTLYVSVDSVVYISNDGGASWQGTEPIRGLDGPITSLLRVGSRLLAGTLSSGLFETADGAVWVDRSEGLAGLGSHMISVLAERDTMLYAGTLGAGVFRNGASLGSPWTQFNQGIPSNLGWNINSLTNIEGTLWAGGGSNAIVYRNGPTENAWVDITFAPFSQLGTACLAVTRFGSNIHAISSQGLHRSTDDGMTWTEFDPGAGYLATGGFTLTPDGLYAFLGKAVSTRLLKLNEDDSTWTLVGTEPGTTFAQVLAGNALYAARLDGLWRYNLAPSDIEGDGGDRLPGVLTLEQNYPNPFNPTTEIRYAVSATGARSEAAGAESDARVRLAVYDLLGREVALLVDEQQEPGVRQVTFDGAGLSAGTYVYRLIYGSHAESRRMLLLK
jgi:hypothetical protein